MRWGSRRRAARAARLVGAVLWLALGALHADAQGSQVGFEVTVLSASSEAGGVDPAARRFHALLGKRVRYESLRVLDSQRARLGVGDIGRVKLPTGTAFRFRPLDMTGQGVLVAIDMGDTAQGDFRIRKGKPLILGGQPYRDGQLVVILEARD